VRVFFTEKEVSVRVVSRAVVRSEESEAARSSFFFSEKEKKCLFRVFK
jgi:hypothetical protein